MDMRFDACRPAAGPDAGNVSPGPSRGFTLLELLVVLSLLGLLAGLVVPNLVRTYKSVRYSHEKSEVLREISTLGYKAYREGRDIRFEGYPLEGEGYDVLLSLPPGWIVRADRPILYRSNGVCLGGDLRIGAGDRWFGVHLSPPLCVPVTR